MLYTLEKLLNDLDMLKMLQKAITFSMGLKESTGTFKQK